MRRGWESRNAEKGIDGCREREREGGREAEGVDQGGDRDRDTARDRDREGKN